MQTMVEQKHLLIVSVGVIGLIFLCKYFYAIAFVLTSVVCGTCGALLSVYVNKDSIVGEKNKHTNRHRDVNALIQRVYDEIRHHKVNEEANEANEKPKTRATDERNYFRSQLLISRNVDDVIEATIDLVMNDFVLFWYVDIIGHDNCDLSLRIKNELWLAISRFLSRLRNIDDVNFVTNTLANRVTKHLNRITVCTQANHATFELSAHLESKEKEIGFLGRVSDVLLAVLLPKYYAKIGILRHLLREIFALHVLYNIIDLICDPDYLNQKIYDYIQWHQVEIQKHKKTYAYAANYEDFIKMIKQTEDTDELKRMRYYVVSEIMQATAMHNLKRERGIENNTNSLFSPTTPTNSKGDLLLSRDLKRYINNLKYAKRLCESRLSLITSVKRAVGRASISSPLPQPNRKKIFAYGIIMSSNVCRSFFRQFLQDFSLTGTTPSEKSSKYLILFWELVEEMKKQESIKQYKIANEILSHSYFLMSISNHTKLPKSLTKGMEFFVKGDKGPESFFEAQSIVYDILEDRYYPMFLVSKDYDTMIDQYEDVICNENIEDLPIDANSMNEDYGVECEKDDDEKRNATNSKVEEHISSAKSKLQQLKQKLSDKTHALTALKESNHMNAETKKPFNVNLKLLQLLTKEIDDLQTEIQQVNCHLEWSQIWLKYLYQWTVELHDIQIVNQSSESPLVVIIIHQIDSSFNRSTNGWVVTRYIDEVIELKRKIIKKKPSLRKYEIFRMRHMPDESSDFILKARLSLEQFLKNIIRDPSCVQSEDVYLFFCPSTDNLRQSISTSNLKMKLPFASFFGVKSQLSRLQSLDESPCDDQLSNDLNIFEDVEGKEYSSKDDVAEHLYILLGEIFELKGATGFLRKTLISFFHISFGLTINKQLRETISWITSESMVFYYFTSFKEAMWPSGQLAKPWPDRNDEEKHRTQTLAKQSVLGNVPDILGNLFGQQNVRQGIIKVFDSLQDKRLNKQLLYEILEDFIFEFVPELNDKMSSNM